MRRTASEGAPVPGRPRGRPPLTLGRSFPDSADAESRGAFAERLDCVRGDVTTPELYESVAWDAQVSGYAGDLDALAERCLRRAALGSEVEDRLDPPASVQGRYG